MSRTYKSYDCTLDNIHEYLHDYGVAVIPNVISEEELIIIRNKMFDTLEHMTQNFDVPIKKDDPNTWKEILKMKPLHDMLYQTFGLGHAQFAWDIRQDPRIAAIFSKLWNVKETDLLSSFDGVSISFPPEITGKGWHRKDWYHCDQTFANNNLHTYQGLVGCYDINEGDATLTVIEGSNKYHKEFAKKFGLTNNYYDWYKLSEAQIAFYESKGCKKTFVKATAGSLVLWDSRTIHAGSGPLFGRPNSDTRLVVYVCQKPKIYAAPNSIIKKRDAFNKKILTSHDPCKIKLFDMYPSFYSKKNKDKQVVLPIDPVLTDLGRSLIG